MRAGVVQERLKGRPQRLVWKENLQKGLLGGDGGGDGPDAGIGKVLLAPLGFRLRALLRQSMKVRRMMTDGTVTCSLRCLIGACRLSLLVASCGGEDMALGRQKAGLTSALLPPPRKVSGGQLHFAVLWCCCKHMPEGRLSGMKGSCTLPR